VGALPPGLGSRGQCEPIAPPAETSQQKSGKKGKEKVFIFTQY